MAVATIAIGTVFGTLAMRTDSVWPVALAHGTLNAVGSLSAFVSGVGLVGVVPWTAMAGIVLVLANGHLAVSRL